MDNNKVYIKSGIGFIGLLTLIFITLKLCKIINWNWLWVLSPLWIPFVTFVLGVLLFLFIVFKK